MIRGFEVVCDPSCEGEFFDDAAAALRYAEFMAELGWDAVYFWADLVGGKIHRRERCAEQMVCECIVLEI